uniref:Uncharacterized protein n=1 Tax=Propithecus coquereli TaxID=379532 RepID=A0A2K6F4I2_PROCO
MATQVMGQSSGGGGLFTGSGSIGMALPNDMYDLHDLSKAELAAPQLIMLANVALTGEVNGSCCDYLFTHYRRYILPSFPLRQTVRSNCRPS